MRRFFECVVWSLLALEAVPGPYDLPKVSRGISPARILELRVKGFGQHLPGIWSCSHDGIMVARRLEVGPIVSNAIGRGLYLFRKNIVIRIRVGIQVSATLPFKLLATALASVTTIPL